MDISTYNYISKHEKVAQRLTKHLTNLINEVLSPARRSMLSLFNSDIVNLLLNINKVRKKKASFVIFVVLYT